VRWFTLKKILMGKAPRRRRRQVLAVELANRESRSSWRDFLLRLKARGLHGVEFVVAISGDR
jgi:transposase-like protein